MARCVSHNENVDWSDVCLRLEGSSRRLGCYPVMAAIEQVTACASVGAVRCF